MDVNQLLDLTERLLILYGYEVERDVGIPGAKTIVADLARETKAGAPMMEKQEMIYRADIFAEKKDIERPFGRIVVSYNRTKEPLTPPQIAHLVTVMQAAGAYMGMCLTVTGYSKEAMEHAVNNKIKIITGEDIETMIGRATMMKPWWQSVNAYKIYFTFEEASIKLRHEVEQWFHRVWEVSRFGWHELAYMPYWKFNCSVLAPYELAPYERPTEEELKKMPKKFVAEDRILCINAHNGMIDTWWDYDPVALAVFEGKRGFGGKWGGTFRRGWAGPEVYDEHIWEPKSAPGPIVKPKNMPKGVRWQVYKPALERWEAKVAATQWMAHLYDIDPKYILITDVELIYFPWWRSRIDFLPYIKNPWGEVEWCTLFVSPLNFDVFNMWKLLGYRRNIVYLMAEKYLVNMLGPERYTKVMNFVTYKIINRVLYWHLHVKPTEKWVDVLFFTLFLLMVYGMLVFKTGLMLFVFIALLFIFIGPGYAFLYVVRFYLKLYPWGTKELGRRYPVPWIHKGLAEKVTAGEKDIEDKTIALRELEEMKETGEMSKEEASRFEAFWQKEAEKEAKKVKKVK